VSPCLRGEAFQSRSPASAPAPGRLLPPEAEKITENVYRIGRVVLDMKARTVTCDGQVNMRKGMIEYMAVTPVGKRHESVLVLDLAPVHLQVAMLLLGLEAGGGLRYQGDPQAPRGDTVEIRVQWREGGKAREASLEELAWDIPRRRPMAPHAWVFTGLRAGGDRPPARLARPSPAGDWEGSLIASFHDPDAMFNNPLAEGSDDTVYKVNERLVPPVGTPVTLTLRAGHPSEQGSPAPPLVRGAGVEGRVPARP
jgi:hypothetical protein